MTDFEKLITDCDAYIRAGQDQKAVRAISDIDIPKIPRKWRLPLANICRRVALVSTGLKILSSIVSTTKGGTPANSTELAEYAALLQKFGAVDDALRFLAQVNDREVPEALLYRAVCHFSRWEYHEAIPILEKYVDVASSPYQALVGRVNLAAALVYTHRLADAENLLNTNIQLAKKSNSVRLEGNCHELLTQVHLLNGKLSDAKSCLSVAESLIGGPGSLDRLYTNKCRAFLLALETSSVKPLLEFRKEALAFPHPETVRETDLYTLIIEPNEKLHEQLYFGTPFKFYRDRMENLFGFRPRTKHVIAGEPDSPCIDIVTGVNSEGPSLKAGSSVHKVLGALLYDFYRPARFGSLFGQLFPGEHFDINSSPSRVHQCLRRTRKWLSDNQIPAEIEESDGSYSLSINGSISFKIPPDRESLDRFAGLLSKLSDAFPNGESFTAAAAQELLGLTSSALHRFLKPMLEAGQIQKFGASTSTIYFIP